MPGLDPSPTADAAAIDAAAALSGVKRVETLTLGNGVVHSPDRVGFKQRSGNLDVLGWSSRHHATPQRLKPSTVRRQRA